MSLWTWALLSFAVGVCVGVVLDDAWEIVRDLRTKKEPALTGETDPTPKKDRPNFLGTIMAAMTLCLMVVTILFIYTLNTVEDYSKCTAEWQQAFGASYQARVTAAEPVSAAMDEIVLAVNSGDKAKFDAAVHQYISVRQQQDKERATNPIPALPKQACGEPVK